MEGDPKGIQKLQNTIESIFAMEYFTHLLEFQVIIYKECQYAILPSYINAHFAAKPQHGLGKRDQDRIVEEVAGIDGLIGNEETLRRCEFQFPPATSKPIAALGEPNINSVQCTFKVAGVLYLYICCSIKKMKEHSCEEHGWRSKDKGGHSRKCGR